MIVSNSSFHPDLKVGTAAQIINSKASWDKPVFKDNIIPGNKYL